MVGARLQQVWWLLADSLRCTGKGGGDSQPWQAASGSITKHQTPLASLFGHGGTEQDLEC